jgi:hypothetical protein
VSDLTPETLDELERLDREATPGPWGYKAGILKHYAFSLDEGEDFGVSLQELHWRDGRAVPAASNAQLLPAMRNALPALIAAARERDRIVARIHRLIPGDQVRAYLLGDDEEPLTPAAPERILSGKE